jgi:dynein heavy chain
MQNRLEQWKRLLERGRPFSFWLAGFSNPVGFLSSIKQEAVIKQKNWALENCVLFTEMTKLEPADLKAPPENGVYVHGLYLDGAAWNKKEGKLVDSPPKVPTMPLPALYICVVEKSAKKYDFQVYECPCYTRQVRGNQTYVFSAELKTEELPSRWILRGVAIICSLAQT